MFGKKRTRKVRTESGTASISITTPLPGPKAAKIIARDKTYLSGSMTRSYPFVMSHGSGAYVTDVDGNRFLDFASGIAVSTTGYAHPEITKVIQQQTEKFLHMSGTDFYYDLQVTLAERLSDLTPIKGDGVNRTFFCNSGTEAVEGALKLARWYTKRPYIISFYGGFHGRSMGALALTASRAIQKKGFSPLTGGVYQAFFPRPYRCPHDMEVPHTTKGCMDFLKETLLKRIVDPSEVAGIILEPLQGEGGYVLPPSDFLQEVRALCDQHGIMLIVDEVQSGMGRTGKMFGIEHHGVQADIICAAKGIASGLPLGAFTANHKIMSWPPGAHSSTFGGNPVACAAALKTLDLLEGGLMKNAAEVGAYLLRRLQGMIKKHKCLGDVRGLGLMIGLEIIHSDSKRKPMPDSARRDALVEACFKRGLLMLGCGFNSLRFAPPLVITKQDADTVITILTQALKETQS